MRTFFCVLLALLSTCAFAQSSATGKSAKGSTKPSVASQVEFVPPTVPPPTEITKRLYAAIIAENFEVADFLVRQGADINCRSCNLTGAPAIASYRPANGAGPSPMLVWLVGHGANVNVPNDRGVTVVMDTLQKVQNTFWSYQRDVYYMIDHGADLSLRDNAGYTALHYLTSNAPASNSNPNDPAAQASFQAAVISTIQVLAERGADVNAAANDGFTPLMNLAQRCNAQMVRALLAKGADSTMRNKAGKTAFDIALEKASSTNDSACNAVLDVFKPSR